MKGMRPSVGKRALSLARGAAALLLVTSCLDGEALGLPGLPGADDDGGSTEAGTTGGGAADFGSGNTFLPDTEGPDADGTGGGGGGNESAAQLYAVARCSALLSCRCPTMPFADVAECETSMANLFVGVQDLFAGAMTDFDCFDAVLAFYEQSACETTLEIPSMSLAPSCALFVDDGALDEACVRVGSTGVHADSCDDGLVCVQTIEGRRCRPVGDTSHVIAAGGTCVGESGGVGPCEGGHWCDSVASQTCVPRVSAGQPCATGAACDTGYCDTASEPSLCEEKLGAGQRCMTTAICASPLCQDGACERPLCANGTCQQGVPQACLSEDL